MKRIVIIVSIIGVVLIGIIGLSSIRPGAATSPPPAPSDTILTQSTTEEVQPATDNQKVNDLKAGGSNYRDPKGVFTFLYPNDYKIDSEAEGAHTRIYKWGATQKGQTEMYDGILMVFDAVDIEGKTLEEYVDEYIKTTTSDGTIQIEEQKKPIVVNGYKGITYKARGLGSSTYIFIQKDASSPYALSITMAVHDPEEKNYKAEVDAILATVELKK